MPTVWLAPGVIWDERELHRNRMAVSKFRTAIKNRIHATLAKYGTASAEHSDIFAGAGRAWLRATLCWLPPEGVVSKRLTHSGCQSQLRTAESLGDRRLTSILPVRSADASS